MLITLIYHIVPDQGSLLINHLGLLLRINFFGKKHLAQDCTTKYTRQL